MNGGRGLVLMAAGSPLGQHGSMLGQLAPPGCVLLIGQLFSRRGEALAVRR